MKFQPVIKWSGSKRALSEEIIQHFPKEINTYYEPFCGSCSMLYQLLNSDIKVNKYVCSDVNEELISYFKLVKDNPISIYEEYNKRWLNLTSFEEIKDKQIYYNQVRDSYNKTKNTYDFIFLTRTSANGLIRYNSKGEFNAPFHLTRNGINPETFKKIILEWSNKLNEKNVEFLCTSYINIKPKEGDYIFLDPPYANTKGMYFGVIDFEELWEWLRNSNCGYSLTFDGKRSETDNTYAIPQDLYSKHIYLDGKISGFQKLHKVSEYVKESLYIK
jgi:DNA adenine methylase